MRLENTETTGLFLTRHKTKTGIVFDPNADRWTFHELVRVYTLDFSGLKISRTAIYMLKRTFIWYLENYATAHPNNMFSHLKELLEYQGKVSGISAENINQIHLINFRNSLGEKKEWILGALAGFLKKWHEFDNSFVTNDAIDYLSETSIKGNPKGEAVRTHDPYDGPLTDLELELIQSAAINAYANGEIESSDYLLIWLFLVYGSRPVQIAALKICDLKRKKRHDGTYAEVISIPRAKQPGSNSRDLFTDRAVPKELTNALFGYKGQIRKRFVGLLDDPLQAPLFPNDDIGEVETMPYHMSSHSIGQRLTDVINSLNVISHRTGERIHINSRRFRYTIGTRAATEGHGELVIAELLDHTDTQNVGVYIEARPDYIKRIDKAIALYVAPLAQAFAGVLLTDRSKATRAGDPTSYVSDHSLKKGCQTLGGCGSFGFCGLLAPIACYTCSSFEPFADGPHEEILMKLLARRKELLETTDERIASINDKTIFAVAEVVRRCQEFNTLDEEQS